MAHEGNPIVVSEMMISAQTGDNSSVLVFQNGPLDRTYRLSGFLNFINLNSILTRVQFIYSDVDGVTQTMVCNLSKSDGTVQTIVNSNDNYSIVENNFRVQSFSNITIQTANSTTSVYDIGVLIEDMGH